MDIQQVARQAAIAKAREIVGEDVIDEREVCQVADAAAVATLREKQTRLYESLPTGMSRDYMAGFEAARGHLASEIASMLAAFTPAEPPQQEGLAVKEWPCSCGARNYEDGRGTCWNCKAPRPVTHAKPQTPEPENNGHERALLLANIRTSAAAGFIYGSGPTPHTPERIIERKNKALRDILTFLERDGIVGSVLRSITEDEISSQPAATPATSARPALRDAKLFFSEMGNCTRCESCAKNARQWGEDFDAVVDALLSGGAK